MMKKVIAGMMAVAMLVTAYAGNVGLAWNPSPDVTVDRYQVFWVKGTNTTFTANNANAAGSLIVTNQTTCTVSNLTSGAWTFVVTAWAANLESDNSNTAWTNMYPKGAYNLRVTTVVP